MHDKHTDTEAPTTQPDLDTAATAPGSAQTQAGSSSSGSSSSPLTNSSSSSGNRSIRLIDDSINVRLWRVQEGLAASGAVNPGDAASGNEGFVSIQQANFYHHPTKMAGPSTRFTPCELSNNSSPSCSTELLLQLLLQAVAQQLSSVISDSCRATVAGGQLHCALMSPTDAHDVCYCW